VRSSYMQTRKSHHLPRSSGLGLWAASPFGRGSALLSARSVAFYEVHYFAAILIAGFVGAGTLSLIMRRRRTVQGEPTSSPSPSRSPGVLPFKDFARIVCLAAGFVPTLKPVTTAPAEGRDEAQASQRT